MKQLRNSLVKSFKFCGEAGFSISGVVVAMGLVGMVTVYLGRTFVSGLRTQRALEQRFGATNLHNEIRSHLTNREACRQTFQTANSIGPTPMSSIKRDNGSVAYALDAPYEGGTLTIQSMSLGGFIADAMNPRTGVATLTLTLDKKGETIGSQLLVRQVEIYAYVNGQSEVTSCIARSGMAAGIWTSKPNQDIFYHQGNYLTGKVGVGVDTPLTQLHVAGGFTDTGLHPLTSAVGKNTILLVENKATVNEANSHIGLLTNSNMGQTSILLSRASTSGWDGIIGYRHGQDTMTFGTNQLIQMLLTKEGYLGLGGYVPSTTNDVSTIQLKSANVAGGSGITVIGNETTSGKNRSRIVLRDQESWALVSYGAAGNSPGGFGINHRNTGIYVLTIEKDENNTGIHISNPTKTLDVNGNSQFRGDMRISPGGRTGDSGSGDLRVDGSLNVQGDSDFSGDITISSSKTVRAGTFIATSDERLKEDFKPIENSLKRLTSLRGWIFKWMDQEGEDYEMGLKAQELEKVFPEAVSEDAQGYKGVNYSSLMAPLIESIKTLKDKINETKLSNDLLKVGIATIQRELEREREVRIGLKKRLKALENTREKTR